MAGQPADAGSGLAGVADDRIGQDRSQQGGLAMVQIARGPVEGAAAARLHAEFAIRAPFRDIEIEFHDPPLGQDQIDHRLSGNSSALRT